MSNYKDKLHHITTFIFDYDGVLTDGTVFPSADGEMMRAANVKDGYALQLAVKKGYRIAIISGGKSDTMVQRMKALNVDDVFLGVSNKREVFDKYVKDHQLKMEEILYMGDDIPDYELLQIAGVSTCPHDAAEEIQEIVDYISHKPGGKGAVRDILRQVMKLQGKWFDKEAFHW
jgi:3-deoxy-D-manno-octulosonate 8-phosphate phosphatase (KDO 8-P phosphatase)